VEVYFLQQLVKINNSVLANDPELLAELENEHRNTVNAEISRRKSNLELMLFRQDQLRSVTNQNQPPTLPGKQLTKNMLKEIIKEVIAEKQPNALEIEFSANGVKDH
jgi:hypothetical protein